MTVFIIAHMLSLFVASTRSVFNLFSFYSPVGKILSSCPDIENDMNHVDKVSWQFGGASMITTNRFIQL